MERQYKREREENSIKEHKNNQNNRLEIIIFRKSAMCFGSSALEIAMTTMRSRVRKSVWSVMFVFSD